MIVQRQVWHDYNKYLIVDGYGSVQLELYDKEQSFGGTAYAVWKKVNASEEYYGRFRIGYGMAYILVKMFDGDNTEENLKNATELCTELNK